MSIYLDSSATTKPCDEAIKAINNMLLNDYGNASSLHRLGIDATTVLISSKEEIASSIGATKEEIFFTSGATEANNLAVFGAVYANRRKGNKIVTTAIEHESVLQSIDELEKEGFEVVRLMPDKFGNITKEQIINAIDDKTILVSIMYVNNEVGSILPVEVIKNAVKRAFSPALIHIDCVQAYGKLPISVKKLGCDLLSITAHKIHGPKGSGALYIKKSVRILPRTFGGEQEKKIRPGTESTPLIAGFSASVKALPDINEEFNKIKEINDYTQKRLKSIDGVIINSSDDALPYILNLYVPSFMLSQTVIQELSSKYEIYVSNGSACAKGKKSHVLSAMGLSDEIISKSIRVSFSRDNTLNDAKAFCDALEELIKNHPKD